MAKSDDLKAKLTDLGVTPEEFADKTNAEMEAMIEAKSTPGDGPTTLSPEEMADLKKQSDVAEAALAAKVPTQKTYTGDEVKAMLAEFAKSYVQKAENPADEDDDGPKKHTVRMARINGKFILGMKNMNKDPYFPDRVTYSQDIFNEQTKQFVPHVTLILEEDETKPGVENTLTIPLETAFKISNKVDCPLEERKQVDASENFGMVEVQEMQPDQYGMKGTGNFVKAKAKIVKETYVVKLPTGKLVEVIPGVVNW